MCRIVHVYFVACVLAANFVHIFCASQQGNLKLVDNGYENLVVKISEDIPKDRCNIILAGLKELLQEFSNSLWLATSYRAFIREVSVILPRSWPVGTFSCFPGLPLGTVRSSDVPHIRVNPSHPIFGDRPWTQQSQGCGKHGDYIQLGENLLIPFSNKNKNSDSDKNIHQQTLPTQLVSEWARLRWGVFEERGYRGDPLYPALYRDPISSKWAPTGCQNQRMKMEDVEAFEGSSSSYSSELKPFFCTAHNHNSRSPTKHNAMCEGKSRMEIIEQSEDFLSGRNPPSNESEVPDPVINFVQDQDPRYILVIEDTATMNMQKRWEFLRKSIKRVVVYDIPTKSYVSVVSFNSVAKTVAKLTYIDSEDSDMRQRVGSALPRNPSSVPESHKCILCGLQEALRTLSEESVESNGATIILITSASASSTYQQINEISKLINEKGLRLILILYPMTERVGQSLVSPSQELSSLADTVAGGRLFSVMDRGVGNDSKVSMLIALMNALLSAVTMGLNWDNLDGIPVLAHTEAYPGGISSMSAGTFVLDDSMESNVRFSVYYYDLNHVGNVIKLITPTGMSLVPSQEEDEDVNMIFVNLENAERGKWSYSVENRADSHQGLYIQVTSRRSNSSKLSIRMWTSSHSQILNMSDLTSPSIIYCQVIYDKLPVVKAKVFATLQRLGTNTTGSPYEPIYISLRDKGNGDPDITANDGVYSRYLPTLHRLSGKYLLTADIEYDEESILTIRNIHEQSKNDYYSSNEISLSADPASCCGSFLKMHPSSLQKPFKHRVSYGILDVLEPSFGGDVIPPSRILDLRVSVNETSNEVTLHWTSPGDDFDYGRAHHYVGISTQNLEDAREFKGNSLTNLPKPLPAGALHTTTLKFELYEELWYVTLRAVDESENRATFGNIASLWVPTPLITYETTTKIQAGKPAISGNISAVSSEIGLGASVTKSEFRIEDLAVLLGCMGGFVLVVLLIACYCLCNYKRHRKGAKRASESGEKADEKGIQEGIIVKVGSCQGLDETADSLNCTMIKEIDTGSGHNNPRSLSPVQSWPASTLLQEHERRLSINSSAMGICVPDNIGYQPNPESDRRRVDRMYPPDVTVTGRQECHTSTPTPSLHNQLNHEPPPYDPPPYTTYPGDERSAWSCSPGPDGRGYWQDPNAALAAHLNHMDRKRRNVTQV